MTKELMELADDYAEAKSARDYMDDQGTSKQMRDEFPQVEVRLKQTKTALQSAIESLQVENERLKDEYGNACKLVAEMHTAAVGQVIGPKRGVVEDVADIRAERDALAAKVETLEADAERLDWLDRNIGTQLEGYSEGTLTLGWKVKQNHLGKQYGVTIQRTGGVGYDYDYGAVVSPMNIRAAIDAAKGGQHEDA